MREFLTAVHHKLPIKAVVCNNSSLGLITLEAEGNFGIPAWKKANFAGLARECGGVGLGLISGHTPNSTSEIGS
jgi:pyruvate dehydrogenase (quinone)